MRHADKRTLMYSIGGFVFGGLLYVLLMPLFFVDVAEARALLITPATVLLWADMTAFVFFMHGMYYRSCDDYWDEQERLSREDP